MFQLLFVAADGARLEFVGSIEASSVRGHGGGRAHISGGYIALKTCYQFPGCGEIEVSFQPILRTPTNRMTEKNQLEIGVLCLAVINTLNVLTSRKFLTRLNLYKFEVDEFQNDVIFSHSD